MILITGANGFIGRRIVQVLTERARAVRRCTRVAGPDSDLAVGGIGPYTNWASAVDSIDTVIHLAARAHCLNDNETDPLAEYRKINVQGTVNLAWQSVNAGVRRFIYISSIGVNGFRNDRPFETSDQPNPVESYAVSKYEAELELHRIAEDTSMELVIIRPPLVYGPGAPGNFARLLGIARKNIPLPLGAIHNKRSFVALDNLVDLIVTCIDHPAAANQTFLAGDGEDVSTTQLLQKLGRAMGKKIWLVPFPVSILSLLASAFGKSHAAGKLFDSLQVDISKARELLGWEPPVSVEEGLRKAVEDIESGL